MNARQCDIAILGGGLAGGLVALAFARHRPDLKVLLVEKDAHMGGNHVWSFFETDVDAESLSILRPLITASWQGYSVRFPEYSRDLPTTYHSITSENFDAQLRAAMPEDAILTGAKVAECSASEVTLGDGTPIHAGAVIDARGLGTVTGLTGGWQKFVGQRLKLTAPHGLERPVVMDATVAQIGGYRFVYALPFAADEVFVEDTYYANDSVLDPAALRERIAAYAAAQGWQIESVLAEEQGVLPVVSGGNFAEFWAAGQDGIARAGTRGGLFHGLTSYSLPDAINLALALAKHPDPSGANLAEFTREWAHRHWQQGRYYRALSALLFDAADPAERYRVLQRFYSFDGSLIERFYAGRSTIFDKARVLIGKAPLPVHRAIGVLSGLGAQPTLLNATKIGS
ncbi:lycopene beta-cyclase CrtY [Novosphingobium sp. Chol11]|uniref:lycopene beta-cyclase CrtY n=1 Tax=Novosphingobium sp. Chol11 TaxID=1385763 RepID=UPI0025D566A4|nr:lycopene beta-cyclase CrtY [Novosphingobium sp. Chol11]